MRVSPHEHERLFLGFGFLRRARPHAGVVHHQDRRARLLPAAEQRGARRGDLRSRDRVERIRRYPVRVRVAVAEHADPAEVDEIGP